MAKDHYLILQEKEVWAKGQKTSKPHKRLIAINDFHSFAEDSYFEKHEISVEILHDPTLETEGERKTPSVKLDSKEELIQEYADLLGVPVSDIDNTLKIKVLKDLIAKEKQKKD